MSDIEFRPSISLHPIQEYDEREEDRLPAHLLREGEIYFAWAKILGPYSTQLAIRSLATLENLVAHPPTRRHPIGQTTMKLIFITEDDYIPTRYARLGGISEDGIWNVKVPIETPSYLGDGLSPTNEGFLIQTPYEIDSISTELN